MTNESCITLLSWAMITLLLREEHGWNWKVWIYKMSIHSPWLPISTSGRKAFAMALFKLLKERFTFETYCRVRSCSSWIIIA